MNRSQWRSPIDAAAAHRRAGGRRRYNARRQAAARERRAWLLRKFGFKALMMVRGTKSLAASIAGVHPATIGRDLMRMLREEKQRKDLLIKKVADYRARHGFDE